MCSFFEDYWKRVVLLPFARRQEQDPPAMQKAIQKRSIENSLRTVISPLIEELNLLLLTAFLANNQKKCTLLLFQAQCMQAIKISDTDELINLTKQLIQKLPEYKKDLESLFGLWEQIKAPLPVFEFKKLSVF